MRMAGRALLAAALLLVASPATLQAQPACTPTGQSLFVRDTLQELYFWYQQLPDVNPARYDSPEQYLEAARLPAARYLVQLHHVARRQRRLLLRESVHRPGPLDDRGRRRDAGAAGVRRQSGRRGGSRTRRAHRRDRRPLGRLAHRQRHRRHGLRRCTGRASWWHSTSCVGAGSGARRRCANAPSPSPPCR